LFGSTGRYIMTAEPIRRIALTPLGWRAIQLRGRTSGTGITSDATGSEFWRSGGTHGNMGNALDADPIHDQPALTDLREELRAIGVELRLIAGHVLIAKVKGFKQLQVWYVVWRYCTRHEIKFHPFAWSSGWRNVTN
jgi:hypothetical protein